MLLRPSKIGLTYAEVLSGRSSPLNIDDRLLELKRSNLDKKQIKKESRRPKLEYQQTEEQKSPLIHHISQEVNQQKIEDKPVKSELSEETTQESFKVTQPISTSQSDIQQTEEIMMNKEVIIDQPYFSENIEINENTIPIQTEDFQNIQKDIKQKSSHRPSRHRQRSKKQTVLNEEQSNIQSNISLPNQHLKAQEEPDANLLPPVNIRDRSRSPIWVPGSTSYAEVLRGAEIEQTSNISENEQNLLPQNVECPTCQQEQVLGETLQPTINIHPIQWNEPHHVDMNYYPQDTQLFMPQQVPYISGQIIQQHCQQHQAHHFTVEQPNYPYVSHSFTGYYQPPLPHIQLPQYSANLIYAEQYSNMYPQISFGSINEIESMPINNFQETTDVQSVLPTEPMTQIQSQIEQPNYYEQNIENRKEEYFENTDTKTANNVLSDNIPVSMTSQSSTSTPTSMPTKLEGASYAQILFHGLENTTKVNNTFQPSSTSSLNSKTRTNEFRPKIRNYSQSPSDDSKLVNTRENSSPQLTQKTRKEKRSRSTKTPEKTMNITKSYNAETFTTKIFPLKRKSKKENTIQKNDKKDTPKEYSVVNLGRPILEIRDEIVIEEIKPINVEIEQPSEIEISSKVEKSAKKKQNKQGKNNAKNKDIKSIAKVEESLAKKEIKEIPQPSLSNDTSDNKDELKMHVEQFSKIENKTNAKEADQQNKKKMKKPKYKQSKDNKSEEIVCTQENVLEDNCSQKCVEEINIENQIEQIGKKNKPKNKKKKKKTEEQGSSTEEKINGEEIQCDQIDSISKTETDNKENQAPIKKIVEEKGKETCNEEINYLTIKINQTETKEEEKIEEIIEETCNDSTHDLEENVFANGKIHKVAMITHEEIRKKPLVQIKMEFPEVTMMWVKKQTGISTDITEKQKEIGGETEIIRQEEITHGEEFQKKPTENNKVELYNVTAKFIEAESQNVDFPQKNIVSKPEQEKIEITVESKSEPQLQVEIIPKPEQVVVESVTVVQTEQLPTKKEYAGLPIDDSSSAWINVIDEPMTFSDEESDLKPEEKPCVEVLKESKQEFVSSVSKEILPEQESNKAELYNVTAKFIETESQNVDFPQKNVVSKPEPEKIEITVESNFNVTKKVYVENDEKVQSCTLLSQVPEVVTKNSDKIKSEKNVFEAQNSLRSLNSNTNPTFLYFGFDSSLKSYDYASIQDAERKYHQVQQHNLAQQSIIKETAPTLIQSECNSHLQSNMPLNINNICLTSNNNAPTNASSSLSCTSASQNDEFLTSSEKKNSSEINPPNQFIDTTESNPPLHCNYSNFEIPKYDSSLMSTAEKNYYLYLYSPTTEPKIVEKTQIKDDTDRIPSSKSVDFDNMELETKDKVKDVAPIESDKIDELITVQKDYSCELEQQPFLKRNDENIKIEESSLKSSQLPITQHSIKDFTSSFIETEKSNISRNTKIEQNLKNMVQEENFSSQPVNIDKNKVMIDKKENKAEEQVSVEISSIPLELPDRIKFVQEERIVPKEIIITDNNVLVEEKNIILSEKEKESRNNIGETTEMLKDQEQIVCSTSETTIQFSDSIDKIESYSNTPIECQIEEEPTKTEILNEKSTEKEDQQSDKPPLDKGANILDETLQTKSHNIQNLEVTSDSNTFTSKLSAYAPEFWPSYQSLPENSSTYDNQIFIDNEKAQTSHSVIKQKPSEVKINLKSPQIVQPQKPDNKVIIQEVIQIQEQTREKDPLIEHISKDIEVPITKEEIKIPGDKSWKRQKKIKKETAPEKPKICEVKKNESKKNPVTNVWKIQNDGKTYAEVLFCENEPRFETNIQSQPKPNDSAKRDEQIIQENIAIEERIQEPVSSEVKLLEKKKEHLAVEQNINLVDSKSTSMKPKIKKNKKQKRIDPESNYNINTTDKQKILDTEELIPQKVQIEETVLIEDNSTTLELKSVTENNEPTVVNEEEKIEKPKESSGFSWADLIRKPGEWTDDTLLKRKQTTEAKDTKPKKDIKNDKFSRKRDKSLKEKHKKPKKDGRSKGKIIEPNYKQNVVIDETNLQSSPISRYTLETDVKNSGEICSTEIIETVKKDEQSLPSPLTWAKMASQAGTWTEKPEEKKENNKEILKQDIKQKSMKRTKPKEKKKHKVSFAEDVKVPKEVDSPESKFLKQASEERKALEVKNLEQTWGPPENGISWASIVAKSIRPEKPKVLIDQIQTKPKENIQITPAPLDSKKALEASTFDEKQEEVEEEEDNLGEFSWSKIVEMETSKFSESSSPVLSQEPWSILVEKEEEESKEESSFDISLVDNTYREADRSLRESEQKLEKSIEIQQQLIKIEDEKDPRLQKYSDIEEFIKNEIQNTFPKETQIDSSLEIAENTEAEKLSKDNIEEYIEQPLSTDSFEISKEVEKIVHIADKEFYQPSPKIEEEISLVENIDHKKDVKQTTIQTEISKSTEDIWIKDQFETSLTDNLTELKEPEFIKEEDSISKSSSLEVLPETRTKSWAEIMEEEEEISDEDKAALNLNIKRAEDEIKEMVLIEEDDDYEHLPVILPEENSESYPKTLKSEILIEEMKPEKISVEPVKSWVEIMKETEEIVFDQKDEIKENPSWASVVSSFIPTAKTDPENIQPTMTRQPRSTQRPIIQVQLAEEVEPITYTDEEGFVECLSKRGKHLRRKSRSRSRQPEEIESSESKTFSVENVNQKDQKEKPKKKEKSKKNKRKQTKDSNNENFEFLEQTKNKEPIEIPEEQISTSITNTSIKVKTEPIMEAETVKEESKKKKRKNEKKEKQISENTKQYQELEKIEKCTESAEVQDQNDIEKPKIIETVNINITEEKIMTEESNVPLIEKETNSDEVIIEERKMPLKLESVGNDLNLDGTDKKILDVEPISKDSEKEETAKKSDSKSVDDKEIKLKDEDSKRINTEKDNFETDKFEETDKEDTQTHDVREEEIHDNPSELVEEIIKVTVTTTKPDISNYNETEKTLETICETLKSVTNIIEKKSEDKEAEDISSNIDEKLFMPSQIQLPEKNVNLIQATKEFIETEAAKEKKVLPKLTYIKEPLIEKLENIDSLQILKKNLSSDIPKWVLYQDVRVAEVQYQAYLSSLSSQNHQKSISQYEEKPKVEKEIDEVTITVEEGKSTNSDNILKNLYKDSIFWINQNDYISAENKYHQYLASIAKELEKDEKLEKSIDSKTKDKRDDDDDNDRGSNTNSPTQQLENNKLFTTGASCSSQYMSADLPSAIGHWRDQSTYLAIESELPNIISNTLESNSLNDTNPISTAELTPTHSSVQTNNEIFISSTMTTPTTPIEVAQVAAIDAEDDTNRFRDENYIHMKVIYSISMLLKIIFSKNLFSFF